MFNKQELEELDRELEKAGIILEKEDDIFDFLNDDLSDNDEQGPTFEPREVHPCPVCGSINTQFIPAFKESEKDMIFCYECSEYTN